MGLPRAVTGDTLMADLISGLPARGNRPHPLPWCRLGCPGRASRKDRRSPRPGPRTGRCAPWPRRKGWGTRRSTAVVADVDAGGVVALEGVLLDEEVGAGQRAPHVPAHALVRL